MLKLLPILLALAGTGSYAADCRSSVHSLERLPGRLVVENVEGSIASGLRFELRLTNELSEPLCIITTNGFAWLGFVHLRNGEGLHSGFCSSSVHDPNHYGYDRIPPERLATTSEITQVLSGASVPLETFIPRESLRRLQRRSCIFFSEGGATEIYLDGSLGAMPCSRLEGSSLTDFGEAMRSSGLEGFWGNGCIGSGN